MMVVHKTADESNTTTTLDDVDEMALPVVANVDYHFEFIVPFKTNAASNGIGLAISCPTLDGSAYLSYQGIIPAGAVEGTDTFFEGNGSSSDDVMQAGSAPAADTIYTALVIGILRNGSNAGDIKLRFKSETAGGNSVTIMKGCVGKLYPQNV